MPMRIKVKRHWALGLLAAGLLVGCYEPPDVIVHEPGQYKGAKDPLLQQDPAARAETLAKRFEMVQTDR